MPEISARLTHRVHADFPHHTDVVLEKLRGLAAVITRSRQDPERILGAAIILADGRLDRLDSAVGLARTDWRDLLVAADLGDAAWPSRLAEWLNPYEPHAVAADPTTSGELIDADGRRWLLRRRRIDLRVVRRLLQRSDVVVVLGDGASPRPVPPRDRASVWEDVRRSYAGPGGHDQLIDSAAYMAYEFAAEDGTVLLYLQKRPRSGLHGTSIKP